MSKKIIISENEKNRIKSLYNLNEQEINPLDIIFKTAMKKLKDFKSGKVSADSEEGDTESEDKTEDKSTSYKSSGKGDFYNITKKIIENFEGGYWNNDTTKPRNKKAYLSTLVNW